VRHLASLHHFHRKYSVCPSHLQDQQRIDLSLFRLDIHFHHNNSSSALLPQALSPQLQKQNANIPPSCTIPMSLLLFSSTSSSSNSLTPPKPTSSSNDNKENDHHKILKPKTKRSTPHLSFSTFAINKSSTKKHCTFYYRSGSFNSMICLYMVCEVQAALPLHAIDLAA
jgi:hypothetical protein